MENLFQFEQDKYYPLRRIPMAIRFRLDICGIKLSIRDWCKFSRDDRERLLVMACDTPAEIAVLQTWLRSKLTNYGGNAAQTVAIEAQPAWKIETAMPEAVRSHIAKFSTTFPTLAQWTGLSDLQRFALIKLTREGHENKQLPHALKEFGLL